MTKLSLLSTAMALVFAGGAAAADLGRRAPAPVIPIIPVFSWTGLYVGVSGGYSFGSNTTVSTTGQAVANINNVNGGARPGAVSLDRDGFLIGGGIGYNYQFPNRVVVGIEGDISYTDLGNARTVNSAPLAPAVGTLTNRYFSSLDYLATVRGRIGYAVFDRGLLYATGGLALGEVSNAAAFFGTAPGNLQFTGRRSSTEVGFTVGGGFEYAFTNNLTAKIEYLYYDLGSKTVAVNVIPGSGGGGTGYNVRFNNDGHIVRAGLNYKFSSGNSLFGL
ncbi:MAG: outer membrane beta-barrel protein [Beijerinckiaceae bacterium]|nr:outer membrane beta-barrel protein [Beijerinckiaceae bacterium]